MILPTGAHTSLMHGWVPIAAQAGTAVAVALALGWRTRRSPHAGGTPRWIVLPVAGLLGLAAVAGAYWYLADDGLADDSAPPQLWVWIALAGAAAGVLVLGWSGASWWRRGVSVLALPLCLLSAALALNLWVGYFPTVQTAWSQLTAGPLPNEADQATVTAMAARGILPAQGRVLPVTIPADASHFKHRGELVYLPPVWFTQSPPPTLPAVMMIGGEFNTPADWLRAGGAVQAVDDFAAEHGGNAPVLVFVDSGGSFNNDTECVNGPRGNAADHLTEDVVPYVVSRFGVSGDPSHWGIAGWSMGGTCAVDLTAMHPEKFSAFVDIAGDLGPNSGNRRQTLTRLFDGSTEALAKFDPTTVITTHGRYTGVSGWFAVNDSAAAAGSGQLAAAESLCGLGRANGIDCAVITEPGKHDWPFAGQAFASALPWLAGRLGTPGVPWIPLPGAATAPAEATLASRIGTTGR